MLPEVNNFDSELALPMLAQSLLPDVYVGLILAGLFAATMPTADSQLLSCSAVITRDFKPGTKLSYLTTKFVTGFVTLIALAIALAGNESVFNLVPISWPTLPALLHLC